MEKILNDRLYTYADYEKWDDGMRYELIDGVVYMMSPSPTWYHQGIIGELYFQLANFLQGKPCRVFLSPLDVRMNADGADDTVVQPDLLIICDRSKLDDKNCKGVPDMAIEVVSPSSSRLDRLLKYQKYQAYGVREYWIVDPEDKIVHACVLENGKYVVSAYCEDDSAPVGILDGCVIDLGKVFADY